MPGSLVTGTIIFRLLETISGITGLYLDVKGGLKNSFVAPDYENDDGNYYIDADNYFIKKIRL